jgi:hypothetical protein
MQSATRTLGLQLHVLHTSTEREFDTVFATLRQSRARVLVIGADGFFMNQSLHQFISQAAAGHMQPKSIRAGNIWRMFSSASSPS